LKKHSDLKLLYRKYINNQLSADEIRDLLVSLGKLSNEDLNSLTAEVMFETPDAAIDTLQEDDRLQRILANVKLQQRSSADESNDQPLPATINAPAEMPLMPFRRKLYTWLSAAAAAILIAGSVIYFSTDYSLEKQAALANLQPGKNKAELTLANGRHITLDDAINGNLAKDAGVQITKTKDGELVYTVIDANAASDARNIIKTPYGGQYMVILPDQSKVWLNAGSSLAYPVSFANAKTRNVDLTGEAYFEIAKDKTHPFIVKTAKQEVKVLGTHFNINSYMDEPAILTTLLEGSVNISSAAADRILKPGEQSMLTAQGIKVAAADTEEVMAWKNGYFRFNDEKLESIMRKIARWYDVEIEFDGEISDEEYNGKISKFKNIAQVLEMLSETNTVHFKIDGRRILVLK